MPRTNWFDDNRQRSYPFQRGTVGIDVPDAGPVTMQQLPDDFIVDCGFLPGPNADFDAASHAVRLHRISRVGDLVRFEFRSDAPALYDHPLIFTRDVAEDQYAYENVETDYEEPGSSASASASASVSEDEVGCFEPLWSGWLVTGRMSEVAARLGDGESIVGAAGLAVIEPATVIDLSISLIESVSLFNLDRTRIAAAEDCPEPVWPHAVDVLFEAADCLRGDLRLEPGYNCRITQQERDNVLTIGAGVGAGAGEPCDVVPLFDSEAAPEGSNLLEGGVTCSETLRRVNGIGGPVLDILTGLGVALVQEPENNRVIIDVNMLGLNYCFDDVSVESVSLSDSESISLQ